MSVVSKAVLKSYFETGDFPTQAQFINMFDTLYPYEKIVGGITQASTNAPTLSSSNENTIGGTITWGYTSTGIYTGTLTGAFTSGKTRVFITPSTSLIGIAWTDVNTITVTTRNSAGTLTNAILSDTSFEIRVYP